MRATSRSPPFLCALPLLFSLSTAFYLPGVAPRDYDEGEPVALKVNKLDSVHELFPYDYYSLPFCRPNGKIEHAVENLGEVLSGDVIQSSAYEINMKIPEHCKMLCHKTYNQKQLKAFRERILHDYRVNWIIDNMPATTKYFTETLNADGTQEYTPIYEKGFKLGFVDPDPSTPEGKAAKPQAVYINNHVRLKIFYHEDPSDYQGSRVVGFEVEPFSIRHQTEDPAWNPESGGVPKLSTCPTTEPQTVNRLLGYNSLPVSGYMLEKRVTFFWTYDVHWEQSDIRWASRWDIYLKMTDSEVHWFSIFNSIIIVLFLSSITAFILVRTLRRDLAAYNEIDQSEDQIQEEKGWKMVHGDVFRPPPHAQYFAIIIGTGTQVLAMTVLVLAFAVLGFLSPANRGGLLTALVIAFVFMGTLAGYSSTRIYKMFGGIWKKTDLDWKKNALKTAFLIPGFVFAIFLGLNFIVWGEKSSGAVPFSILVALILLWFGISVPLTYIGAYAAWKKPAWTPPVKVTEIARQSLLEPNFWTHPLMSVLAGGILPFGAAFIEIFFILSSIWLHQFYYVFGFLFLIFIIEMIVSAEISIVLCYFQLCNEDCHWWWRSFLSSGTSGLYLFLYSMNYFFTRLDITQFASGVMFFGYMFLASLFFALLTGTAGYYASFYFVNKIYSSLKVD